MLESALHDHVRNLEKKLRASTPASKTDIDEITERLTKIEQSIADLHRLMQSGYLRHAEATSLVPLPDDELLHHH